MNLKPNYILFLSSTFSSLFLDDPFEGEIYNNFEERFMGLEEKKCKLCSSEPDFSYPHYKTFFFSSPEVRL